MTTPPNANAVSDARLRVILNSVRPKLVATADDLIAALRELQARRASDATREPAPGVVEALRRLCKVLQTHRLSAEHDALGAAVAALAAHDARQPQRDPVQAVLAEVAALIAGREPSGKYAGEVRSRIDEAVKALRYAVLRLDREAAEKGDAP